METAATIRRLQLASQVTEERASIALCVVMAKHLRAPLLTLDANLANAPTLGVDTLVP